MLCNLLDHSSSCYVDVGRDNFVNLTTRLDLCAQPPVLDIVAKQGAHEERHVFSSHNPHDSRSIGPDFWPSVLHISFDRSDTDFAVTGCVQSLKVERLSCFLNDTVGPHRVATACAAVRAEFTASTALVASVLCFVSLVVLLTLATSAVIWFRRSMQLKKRLKFRHVPPLPSAKPYEQISKRKSAVDPTEFAVDVHYLLDDSRVVQSHSFIEARSIQTSTTSLLFEGLTSSISHSGADTGQIPGTHTVREWLQRQRETPERQRDTSSTESSV